ncbi:MAG: aspartate-semialdehyde dehydrogenase [Porphyrobacter sp.]|nr:aspartate-semialdehyde dehydrogenase [Porphyrobacter sp.]
MRNGLALATLTVALALAGCDSGEVPNPADTKSSAPAEALLAANAVELRGDGLATGSESFYFAAGQAEVESALANVLGQKLRSGENQECGAGPITFTDFAGGLTAHFQKGRLVGWNWHAPHDGDAAATGTIQLPGKVQVGSARTVLETAPGFAMVEGSTLGEEFALGEKLGGFVAGDKVEMLYAGTQCFFR